MEEKEKMIATKQQPQYLQRSLFKAFFHYDTIFLTLPASIFLSNFWKYNVTLTTELHPLIRHHLKPSWLGGILLKEGVQMDLRDPQWNAFRSGMFGLICFFTLQACIRYTFFKHNINRKNQVGMIFSLLFIFFLHRVDSLFVLLIIVITFLIRKSRILSWIFQLFILFSVKQYGNYLIIIFPSFFNGTILASNAGIIQWTSCYNLVFLRMISFIEDDLIINSNSFEMFLYYICYPPLYLSGPTIRYEEFFKQQQQPLSSSTNDFPSIMDKVNYGIRLLVDFILFEIFNTVFHSSAIVYGVRNEEISLKSRSLPELAYWSFTTLFGVWFKFLIIWRFARFFSLIDGVNPPENMKRCIANNYSFRGFWKDWHCSFNAWLVRYIYIPFGGNKYGLLRQVIVSSICFLFVAMWHDIEFIMALWGIGLSIALIPEFVLVAWSNKSAFALRLQREVPLIWDMLTATAGATAIVGLEFLNILGYTLLGQAQLLLDKMKNEKGSGFFLFSWWAFMWCGALFMIRIRRREEK